MSLSWEPDRIPRTPILTVSPWGTDTPRRTVDSDDCRLIACADIVRPNAEKFAEKFDIALSSVYEDYQQMLREEEPDLVSVCVPPAIHADIVIGCAESDAVGAIHCEKPMATTWEDCERMVRVCEERDVRLTFNHQRRFGKPFTRAKELLDGGKIGSLIRIEIGGINLYDYGTHHFDLCGYYTDQASPKWVLAQIDYTEENVQFGAHNENQALAQWRYDDGCTVSLRPETEACWTARCVSSAPTGRSRSASRTVPPFGCDPVPGRGSLSIRTATLSMARRAGYSGRVRAGC